MFAGCFLCQPSDLNSAFYRYTDSNGTVHFVDDVGLIPAPYRDAIRTYPEKYDHLTDAERRRCESEEQYAALYLKSTAGQQADVLPLLGRPVETPVVIRDQQILVPVVLMHGGRHIQVRLLLDTGATTTVLYQDAARAVGLQGGRKREARMVDGQRIEATEITLAALRLGPFRFSDITTAIIEHRDQKIAYQGLLGMNILQQVSYTVDMKRQSVRWHPHDSAKEIHNSCAIP